MIHIGKTEINYRDLLIKYISHVVAAEGESFARKAQQIAPCKMAELDFSDNELYELNFKIFPEVLKQSVALRTLP